MQIDVTIVVTTSICATITVAKIYHDIECIENCGLLKRIMEFAVTLQNLCQVS